MPTIRRSSVIHLANAIKDSGRNPRFALFLGAGASVQSGIITANEMIKFFKGRILEEEYPKHSYLTEQQKENWFEEQDWYKTNESEYSKCFEHFAPKAINRQRYIEKIIDGRDPSFGYLVLANLLAGNYINTIITTNFDDLVYSACTSYTGIRPIVHAYGNFASEIRITSHRPKIFKLHGDYLYKVLNTVTETALPDLNMKEQVLKILSEYSLIVIGYGGGDTSVMDMLYELSEDNDLYWCILKGKQPDEKVKQLLEAKGGYIVEINGFDQMMFEVRSTVGVNVTKVPSFDSFLESQIQFIEKVKTFKDEYRIEILNGFVTALEEQEQQAKKERRRLKDAFDCLKLYTQAVNERDKGNITIAENLFQRLIKKNSKFKIVHNDLGIIFSDMGDDDAAEAAYLEEIEINPEGIDAYGNLVLLLRKQGRSDEAREIAEKAVQNNAASLQIFTALIAIHRKDGNTIESGIYEAEARKLLEPDAWYDIASVECVCGNRHAAIANLKLEAAAKGKDFDRKFAKIDPDLESIREWGSFRKIVND